MFDLVTYKWIHLSGVFIVVLCFGAMLYQTAMEKLQLQLSEKGSAQDLNAVVFSSRMLKAIHGIGMMLVLIGGFGMLARLGIVGAWPKWVTFKVTIWIILGFMITAILKINGRGKLFFGLILLLVMTAAYLGLKHPQIG